MTQYMLAVHHSPDALPPQTPELMQQAFQQATPRWQRKRIVLPPSSIAGSTGLSGNGVSGGSGEVMATDRVSLRAAEVRSLLRLHAGRGDHLRPLRDLVVEELRGFLRRVADRLDADRLEAPLDVG